MLVQLANQLTSETKYDIAWFWFVSRHFVFKVTSSLVFLSIAKTYQVDTHSFQSVVLIHEFDKLTSSYIFIDLYPSCTSLSSTNITTSLRAVGLIPELVEHCTGAAEVRVRVPVEA